MRTLVLGAGGFIGSHLVRRLKKEGHWVRGVDLKYPQFSPTRADDFVIGDLRDPYTVRHVMDQQFDEVYQLAADMGGAGYIFTGENDADIMHNSATINLNVLNTLSGRKPGRIFYSSSACVYSEGGTAESNAYPANPDSNYGWEKLFSERLYRAYADNKGLQVRIARFHNIFGEEGTFTGGREKAPAAICRKIAEANIHNPEIIIWGDGNQKRSFLYIDECITGVLKLMRNKNNFEGPVNIGSTQQVTINQLVDIVSRISGKDVGIKYQAGPRGVSHRTSDNTLIKQKLKWAPKERLEEGLKITYKWIEQQVLNRKR